QHRLASATGTGYLAAAQRFVAFLDLQRLDQLIEEHGDAVVELDGERPGQGAQGDLGPATGDELAPVIGEELMQHPRQLTRVGGNRRHMNANSGFSPPLTSRAGTVVWRCGTRILLVPGEAR